MPQEKLMQDTEPCLSSPQRIHHEILLDQRLLEGPPIHLWHSEHKASTVETSFALDSIASRDTALETLDTLLGELEGYRQELEKARDLYKGILCPIHRLPDEILREILVHFCDDSIPIELAPTNVTIFSETDPVYVVGRVCSRWTRVSHSTVQLWTEIDYNLATGDVEDWARFMAFSDRLLARSQNAPLSIQFFPEELDFSSEAKAARTRYPHIFDALIRSTDRWKKFSANARCIALLQDLGIIPAALPNVTFIDLQHSFDKGSPYTPDSQLYPLPLDLPSVHTLFVTNTLEPTDPAAENYDFLQAPNIRCVDISEYGNSRFMLPHLTTYQLETLTLTLGQDLPAFYSTSPFAPPLDGLLFSKLRTLNIQTRDDPRDAMLWALQNVTCPSLNALALCATDDEEGTDAVIKALSDFLSRSGCKLDKLTLSNIPPVDILEALNFDALQSISDLSIRLTSYSIAQMYTFTSGLTSLPSSYQLSRLWIRVNRGYIAPVSDTPPLSLPLLADLCKASIWKNGPNTPAQIRFEFPMNCFPQDLREEIVKFCDSTRRSHVCVYFADDPTYWQHHLIDELEDDL
ncbi:hypothetical protein BKA70DRAFT_1408612 [Coprinopsis sp. MPI-PUGE-AT-0042]|nr:hypothetical protein BKA70DRAFT_1408612 [Coprinopsis sp. MPI-PUGE-AT-0042]